MRTSLPFPELPGLARASTSWLATLGVGLALGMPGAAAGADSLAPGETTRTNPYGAKAAPQPPAWLGANVHYRKGVGLEYQRSFKLGDKPLELGFQGPVVRKKKRVGLTVELRF